MEGSMLWQAITHIWRRSNWLGKLIFILLVGHTIAFALAVIFSLSDGIALYCISSTTLYLVVSMLDTCLLLRSGKSFMLKKRIG